MRGIIAVPVLLLKGGDVSSKADRGGEISTKALCNIHKNSKLQLRHDCCKIVPKLFVMKTTKVLLIVVGVFAFTQAYTKQFPIKRETNIKAFNSGEKLTYLLHYGFINGGKATLTLSDKVIEEQSALHAKMYAKTTGVTDKIFHIEDVYESYFDHEYTLPYKSVRDISEGGYKYYNEVNFAHNDTTVNSHKSGEHSVPKGTLDMVSALYHLRTIDFDNLAKGDELNFNTFFDDEVFPFKLRYKGTEKVKTKHGKIRCHRFDPIVEPGRIFKSEDDMSFWLTDDENLVPVLIKFDLIVGSVKCELIEYENLQSSINWER